jgi:CheY-like chemotaxis protein
MGGRQLAEQLAQIRPDLPILFMSGYTDDAIFQRGDGGDTTAFVPKPISPLALARKVRQVLDTDRESR